nr:MAG TPA: hypothetical protein [Caudoviricetes sp.]
MEEEVNESVNNLEVAEQEEVVENTANETETTEQVSEQVTEQVEEVEEQEEQETEKQSNEENAKYASIRRKAQEDAKKQIEQARKEAYEQGLNQGKVQSYIGRNNPYTGQTIKDEYDVQEYLDMYELDSKGEDPITGYRELQKDKARKEAEEKVKAEEQSKQEKWYQDDTKDFVEKYSAEKLQELGKDEDFNLFANGKIGKVPLAQIYEDYQKLINKYEKKSVETAKQIVANNSTTPGAIEDTEVQDLDWNSMSSEQFEKYIQKAKDGELK